MHTLNVFETEVKRVKRMEECDDPKGHRRGRKTTYNIA